MQKKPTPTISIIVPNHNYAQYLPSALDSIKHQTFSDWECIVIDDASIDDYVKIIKKYIRADKRFKLIQLDTQLGISAARNRGLDAARGEYIAFLDSDDCYTQNALEILLQLIKTTNADMAGGRTIVVNPEFKFVPTPQGAITIEDFSTTYNPIKYVHADAKYRWVWVWRRLYKRSFIGDVRFNEKFKTLGDDLCFMLDLCARDCLLAECTNLIVHHRLHLQSVTAPKITPASFDWFPAYFEHLRDNFVDKYDYKFVQFIYDQAFRYLLSETAIIPKAHGMYLPESKHVLIESCKLIPRRYLKFKFRMLCWFLSCMK